jgi:murein tripeptide amidase MpaA
MTVHCFLARAVLVNSDSSTADRALATSSLGGPRVGAKKFLRRPIRRIHIFERLEVIVFPNVNPDGREHSLGHDAMWRRNRNPVESGGRPACVGVDVNRNFPFLWDFEHRFSTAAAVATASDPCDASQTYRGDVPASEPETRNVIAAMDASSSLSWYVDVHSFGERILHPWGDDENQTANPSMTYRNADYDERRGLGGDTGYREFISPADAAALRDAAERMRDAVKKVRGHQYVIQQSFALYPASGCSDDYAFARRWTAAPNRPSISSFTIESGKEFQPRWDEARRVVQEIAAALTALCARAAGAGS